MEDVVRTLLDQGKAIANFFFQMLLARRIPSDVRADGDRKYREALFMSSSLDAETSEPGPCTGTSSVGRIR